METIDKNVLRLIALELDLPSLLRFCQSDKFKNQEICESNIFWRLKLNRDYPETISKFNDLPNVNYKKIYVSMYNNLSQIYTVILNWVRGPFLYDYIQKGDITTEDVENLQLIYPEFLDETDNYAVYTIGNFPKGTKVWLAYTSDWDLELDRMYLSKEQARNALLKTINRIIRESFMFIDYGVYENHFHMSETETLNDVKNTLLKNDKVVIKYYIYQELRNITFGLKEFVLP